MMEDPKGTRVLEGKVIVFSHVEVLALNRQAQSEVRCLKML